MLDLRQSPQYAFYMEKIGWLADEFKNLNLKFRFYIKKIPILGNFIKILRPNSQIPLQLLDQIAHQYKAWAVQVNYSPTKTLRLDLNSPLKKIYQQMSKKSRYEIRKAKANKIKITNSSDIELFADLWQKNALRRGFWLSLQKEIKSIYRAFGKNAYLLLASSQLPIPNSQFLAGALILISGKTAAYFHACSTPTGRQFSAPSLLVREAIKLAKGKGCRVFDFEGIYDERFPVKSWLGFTHFKKGFGGKEKEFPKNYTKFYRLIFKLLPGFANQFEVAKST